MDNQNTVAIVASITPILVAIVGYFLKQSLNSVKELAEEIKKVVAILQAHTTGLAVIETKHLRMESDIKALSDKYQELANFLHAAGFHRRSSHSSDD